jgi:hypothetical protein
MLDLIRKRHDGDGWLVFSEVGNRPGLYMNRRADALALGVWAGKKYEAHYYEFKISRSDLVRELKDPSKAEGVGKYCTYWWLVVSDESVIRDVLIPDMWGILIPITRGNQRMLTVHRKAKKLTPKKFDHLFAVSLIRNMAKRWKSDADYERVIAERDAALEKRELAPTPTERDKDNEIHDLKRRIKDMEDGIKAFEESTGVNLGSGKAHNYQMRNYGRSFKLAEEIENKLLSGELGSYVHTLSKYAENLENGAKDLAAAAVRLRELKPIAECPKSCRSQSGWGAGRCDCGRAPLSKIEKEIDANHRRDKDLGIVEQEAKEYPLTLDG